MALNSKYNAPSQRAGLIGAQRRRHRPMARKAAPLNVEKSLDTLESLVEQMESGDLSLEDSLKAFEEGVKLTRECQQALKAAEQKVRILMEADETSDPEPFEPDTGND